MAKKFENKKLNKEDHANVEKDAGIARKATGTAVGLATLGVIIKKVPWKKVGGALSKVIFRG